MRWEMPEQLQPRGAVFMEETKLPSGWWAVLEAGGVWGLRALCCSPSHVGSPTPPQCPHSMPIQNHIPWVGVSQRGHSTVPWDSPFLPLVTHTVPYPWV